MIMMVQVKGVTFTREVNTLDRVYECSDNIA